MSKSKSAKETYMRSAMRYGDYYLGFVRDNQDSYKNKSIIGNLEIELQNIGFTEV